MLDTTPAEERTTTVVAETACRQVESDVESWEQLELATFLERVPERPVPYLTGSRRPVRRVYTPIDVAGIPWEAMVPAERTCT